MRQLQLLLSPKFWSILEQHQPEQISICSWRKCSNSSGDEGYKNAVQFIGAMMGRNWDAYALDWCLNYLQGNSTEKLHWVPRGTPNKVTGRWSGGDSHFMSKSEVNQLPALSGRINHAAHPSTEIP